MDIISSILTKKEGDIEHWDIIAFTSLDLLLEHRIKDNDPTKNIQQLLVEDCLNKLYGARYYSFTANIMELWQHSYEKSGDAFFEIKAYVSK
jgi:hypothetical protein